MDPAIAPPPPPGPPAPADGGHVPTHGDAGTAGGGHPAADHARAAGGEPPATHHGREPHGPAPDARQRAGRLAGLAAVVGATAYVGLVDPSEGGAFPLCPSRVLLGLDCPACGGLRGTHDLLNGDIVGALDHNALLPALLAVHLVALLLWLRPLAGRPSRPLRVPRWAVAAGIVVAVAFTVLRNLPVAGLEFLGSA